MPFITASGHIRLLNHNEDDNAQGGSFENFASSSPDFYFDQYCDFTLLKDGNSGRFLTFPESFILLIAVGLLNLTIPEILHRHSKSQTIDDKLQYICARIIPFITGILHFIAVIVGIVAMSRDFKNKNARNNDSTSKISCNFMFWLSAPLYVGLAASVMSATAKVSRSKRGVALLFPRYADNNLANRQVPTNALTNNCADEITEEISKSDSETECESDSSSTMSSSFEDDIEYNNEWLSSESDDDGVLSPRRQPLEVIEQPVDFNRTSRHWHSIGAQPILWLTTPYLLLVTCSCLPIFVLFFPAAIFLLFLAFCWIALAFFFITIPMSIRLKSEMIFDRHTWRKIKLGVIAMALPSIGAMCSISVMSVYSEGLGRVTSTSKSWSINAWQLFMLSAIRLFRFDDVNLNLDFDRNSAIIEAACLTLTAASIDLLNEVVFCLIPKKDTESLKKGNDTSHICQSDSGNRGDNMRERQSQSKKIKLRESQKSYNDSIEYQATECGETWNTNKDEEVTEMDLLNELQRLEKELDMHRSQLSLREQKLLGDQVNMEMMDEEAHPQIPTLTVLSNTRPDALQRKKVVLNFRKFKSKDLVRNTHELRQNAVVESVTLNGEGCTAIGGGVAILCRALRQKKYLKRLRINSCRLAFRAFSAVNHLLMEHQCLLHIDLSDNEIDHKMLHDLASAIEKNRTLPLEHLQLNRNPLIGHKARLHGEIGDGDFEGISHLIAVTYRRLKALEIANVGLDDNAHFLEPRIFEDYFVRGSIEQLNIKDNNLGTYSLDILLGAAKTSNSKLCRILLSGNHLLLPDYLEQCRLSFGQKIRLVDKEKSFIRLPSKDNNHSSHREPERTRRTSTSGHDDLEAVKKKKNGHHRHRRDKGNKKSLSSSTQRQEPKKNEGPAVKIAPVLAGAGDV